VNVKWSNNWYVFIEEVGRLIKYDETTETLSKIFAGKTVRWSGVVDEIDLDEMAPGVDVDMPLANIELNDGTRINISGLHLPIDDNYIMEWQKVNPGDLIDFEATLGRGDAPFPPIELQELCTGRKLLRIRVNNAKLRI